MKWNNAIFFLALVVFLNVLSTQAAANKKKEAQSTKHKNDKIHKLSVLGQKEPANGPKGRVDHHAVKEVQKHAPLTISHHEASIQTDLGYGKPKPSHNGPKSDMKLQDLLAEDELHRKRQNHKSHSSVSHDNHSSSSQSTGHAQKAHVPSGHKMMSFKSSNSHTNNGHADKYNKSAKPPKKATSSNKFKKNKRIKRLHKQFIF